MRKTEAKTILSTQNGMNPYRGGGEETGFPDARFTDHRRKGRPEEPEAKMNAPLLLEVALRRKRSKCMITAGAMYDPYCPEEAELLLTRKCLAVIDRYGFGAAIQTRSSLVLRDLDLLQSIQRKSRCIVQMSLSAAEEELREKLEPGSCTTAERLDTLRQLKAAGIPTIVRFTPLLPFVNATEENLKALLAICVESGVYGIQTLGLSHMYRAGDRERFYRRLEECFPGMRDVYQKTFGNETELCAPEREALLQKIRDTCRNYHIEDDAARLFTWLHAYVDRQAGEQMSLFDLLPEATGAKG